MLLVISRNLYYDKGHKAHKSKEKIYSALGRKLNEAIKEYEDGKCMGPFTSIDELRKSLER